MSESAKKLRVLVVDDLPMMHGAFRRALGDDDFEITTAADYASAIILLEVGEFDVVVTDTNLGKGPWGPELLGVVRMRWPKVARVIMSGENQEEALPALESGTAHVFLYKPWESGGPKSAIAAALAAVAAERRSA